MKYKVYCIYDNVRETYNLPFFETTEKSAIRGFEIALKNISKDMGDVYAKDYDLYFIGEFDALSGQLSTFESKSVVVRGEDYVKGDE